MSTITRARSGATRSRSTAVEVNAAAMVAAMAAIVWQIAAGVDYPPVPPGLVILAIAAAVVWSVRARWARIVGIAVPLFLAVGGTIASIADDGNALRHPGDAWPFVATVLQLTAVGVALVAGVLALRELSQHDRG